MATRTPRIMPTLYNLGLASTTIVTASSQETSLPVAFLRDPLPTRKWRSKLGWNIVAGFNDKLDFQETAAVRVATIAAGNYATGAAMATAVQTALNSAPGHTNTYTVTYDVNTKKFTLAKSAGPDTITWLFSTGANTVAGLAIQADLGFTSITNFVGTAASDVGAYHSREWVRFDFTSAPAATVAIIHAHNMGTGGTATLYLKTADSIVWTSPGFTQALTGDDLAGKRIAFFASQTYRYALLLVSDVGNTAGYSEFGVPFVGTYWQPGRGFQPGATRQAEALSVAVRADQGALYLLPKASPKDHAYIFSGLGRSDRDAYQAIEDDHRHVFFAKDATGFPGADTFYGVLLPAAVKDYGPLGDLFSLETTLLENLG